VGSGIWIAERNNTNWGWKRAVN